MRHMSKPAKAVLGALTITPLLYMVFFVMVIMTSAGAPGAGLLSSPEAFAMLFLAHGAVMLLIMGQTMLYVVHALTKNDGLEDSVLKAIWALILLMGNALAIPIYFMLYVWPEPEYEFVELPNNAWG